MTLKAANGLEIPYSGVTFVELELLGQTLQSVPVLVVRDSNDPTTRKRKWQVPALVGMNVLVKAGNVLSSLETVPSALNPALPEARLEHTSVRGVARYHSHHRGAEATAPAFGITFSTASTWRFVTRANPRQ